MTARQVEPLDVDAARAGVEREVLGVLRALGQERDLAPLTIHAAPPGLGKTRGALRGVWELVDGHDPSDPSEPARPRGTLVLWVARGRGAVLDVVGALKVLGLAPEQAVYALGRAGAPGAPFGLQAGRLAGGDVVSCVNPLQLQAARAGVRLEGVCGRGVCAWSGDCYAAGWSYGTAGGKQRASAAAAGVWSVGSACVVVPDALAPLALELARKALACVSPSGVPARVVWVWDDADPVAFGSASARGAEVLRALAGVAGVEALRAALDACEAAAGESPAGARRELPPLPPKMRRAVRAASRDGWSEAELTAGVAYGRGVVEVLRALAAGRVVEASCSHGGAVELVCEVPHDWSASGLHLVLSATDPRNLWRFLAPPDAAEVLGEGWLAAHGARVEVLRHEDCGGRGRLARLSPQEAAGVARTSAREWAAALRRRGRTLPPSGPNGAARVLLVGPLAFVQAAGVLDAFAEQLRRELGRAVEGEAIHWNGADVAGSNRWESWEAAALVVFPRPNPHAVHRAHGLRVGEVESDPDKARRLEGESAAGELLQALGRVRPWSRAEGVEVAVVVGKNAALPRALLGLKGPPLELVPVVELGVEAAPTGRPPARTHAELRAALDAWPAWSSALDRALGVGSGGLTRFLYEPSNLPHEWRVRRRALTGQRGRAAEWVGPSEGAILEAVLRWAELGGRAVDPSKVRLVGVDLEQDAEGLEINPNTSHASPDAEPSPDAGGLEGEAARLWARAGGAAGRARLEAQVGAVELARLEAGAAGRAWTPADVADLAHEARRRGRR